MNENEAETEKKIIRNLKVLVKCRYYAIFHGGL